MQIVSNDVSTVATPFAPLAPPPAVAPAPSQFRSCARAGVNYCDITGEIDWVRDMIEQQKIVQHMLVFDTWHDLLASPSPLASVDALAAGWLGWLGWGGRHARRGSR